MTGRRVSLSNAQASESLRLSGGGSVTAAPGPAITADDLRALVWRGERPLPSSRLLGQTAMNWAVLAVEDQQSPVAFDGIDQCLEWQLRSAGQTVTVRLPYRPTSAAAVHNLELQAERGVPDFITGRLRPTGDGLELWPISVFTGQVLTNLSTPRSESERSSRKAGKSRMSTDVVQSIESTANPADSITHLDRLSARIVRIADGGHRPTTATDLASLATDARNWGLESLAQTISTAPRSDVALLRVWWAMQLARDADT